MELHLLYNHNINTTDGHLIHGMHRLRGHYIIYIYRKDDIYIFRRVLRINGKLSNTAR